MSKLISDLDYEIEVTYSSKYMTCKPIKDSFSSEFVIENQNKSNFGSILVTVLGSESIRKGIYTGSFQNMRPETTISGGFKQGQNIEIVISEADIKQLLIRMALGNAVMIYGNGAISLKCKYTGERKKKLIIDSPIGIFASAFAKSMKDTYISTSESLKSINELSKVFQYKPDERTAELVSGIKFGKTQKQKVFESQYQQEVLGESRSTRGKLTEPYKPGSIAAGNIEWDDNKTSPNKMKSISGLNTSLLGWCCKCDKPVDSIRSDRDIVNRETYLEAKCHGESDRITVTGMELIVMETTSKFRRMDFFKSEKKEKKKEDIRTPIGKRKLL